MTTPAQALSDRARLTELVSRLETELAQHREGAAARRAAQVARDEATLERVGGLVKELAAFRDVPADALRAPLGGMGQGDLERENAPEVLAKVLRIACEQAALIHYGLGHRIANEPKDEIAEALERKLSAARAELAEVEQVILSARELARAMLDELSAAAAEIEGTK